ncbi:GAF and ANTAR domain-containing protein [Actinomycetospora cinnamomea]|uniref:ANTAR domain-containing protein n=1 Tax=Actinomycetospora cinnamomea TaxID=663609 RepID=A0A2U1F482_9PSEU|nr:GAF and ANTAR domain-containing protein [Actinomycetospora cinnamomea]PVZ06977.1 ANTAR domain-containing protein [Actinomycetospora cinnamomea]
MAEDALVAHLRRTTRQLNSREGARDHHEAVERIVEGAVAAVPGAQRAGITPADDHLAPEVLAGAAGPLDVLQCRLGEGPASSVLSGSPADGTVAAADLAGPDGERWPRFAPCAVDAGYRSMVSVLLEVESSPRAALNLYGADPHGFDAEDLRAAGLFAIDAQMLLLAAEHVAGLQRALDSRDVIGRAKGMLMERFGIDQEAAFRRLVEASQHTNLKLVEVARWLDRQCGTRHEPAVEEAESPHRRHSA